MAADTIFALSSGAGAAGVAVIRISGPRAGAVITSLCGDCPAPRAAALRLLRDPADGAEIDSAVVLFFPAPRSFTGEEVAELQLHGSLGVIRRITSILAGLEGLRAADAGEFSRRALANGKLDLIEVEALSDLLAAETVMQAKLARRYQRDLRAAAARWREGLLSVLALTEAYIDFSDEDDVANQIDSDSEQELGDLQKEIASAAAGLAVAERIRRGFRIAIMGPPNAGKSSLLNALAARDVAITSPTPGTTRDAIEVHLELAGLPVVLVDTAGLRDALDPVEQEGVQRAHRAGEDADLVLWLSPADGPQECPFADALIATSKSDLMDSDPERLSLMSISTRDGTGLPELVGELRERARTAVGDSAGALIVASQRQAAELGLAADALGRARRCGGDVLELRAEELRSACRALDRLTGRIGYEEVLGAIFSRFCVGK